MASLRGRTGAAAAFCGITGLYAVCIVASAVALLTRYRRARGIERLRTRVDLDELTGDLAVVVAKAVQPSATSVWIRR